MKKTVSMLVALILLLGVVYVGAVGHPRRLRLDTFAAEIGQSRRQDWTLTA